LIPVARRGYQTAMAAYDDKTHQGTDPATELARGSWALRDILLAREAFLNQLGEGVIIADGTGAISFVNDAARHLHGQAQLGVEPGEYSASYNLLTMAGDPFPDDRLPLTRAVRDGETVVDERWRIRRADGSEILAIGSARPIHNDEGTQIGSVLTIRDDTRRHADEQALKEMVRAKDLLLHEVNHRVKNSLQLVTSLLSLQAMRAEDPRVRQGLEEASQRVGVVARIHQRLYTTSDHDRVNMGTLLCEVAEDNVKAHALDGQIDLKCDCEDLILSIDQAIPLALCVSELLVNAIKYSVSPGETGTIYLNALSMGNGVIRIEIEDDGCGLPADFDPEKSTGLGMKIVQALMRQLRAKLSIDSGQGRTRFTIMMTPSALD
jgi:PAS domain S-box-containing protein